MKRVVVLIAIGALAACNSNSAGPTIHEKNASVADVARQVRDASNDGNLHFQPGRWVSTVTVDAMSIPGLPPQAAAMMKKNIGMARTFATCLTPEEANKPNSDFFSGKNDCRYDHFTMGSGKIDAKMVCSEGGQSQDFQVTGTYAPDAYHMAMAGNVGSGPNGQSMTMRSHVDSKRVGPCTGKEES